MVTLWEKFFVLYFYKYTVIFQLFCMNSINRKMLIGLVNNTFRIKNYLIYTVVQIMFKSVVQNMCWATNTNQSRYLTFQMSKNIVSFPLAHTNKIGVAIFTRKDNAFVKKSPFLQCFFNFICNSQRCFVFSF